MFDTLGCGSICESKFTTTPCMAFIMKGFEGVQLAVPEL